MKVFLKVLIIVIIAVLAVVLLALAVFGIGRAVNVNKYKIETQSGVQVTGFLELNGMEQYINIRGEDESNPVIVMLHGGPGNTMAYYSYQWQHELEEQYTVGHWDQRGSGNTYFSNQSLSLVDKPTLYSLISDLDKLVEWLLNEYGKQDVIIMGHSWGTVLGGIYTEKYPEKVSRYVAVGQIVDAWEGEEIAAGQAALLATQAGKSADAQEIMQSYQALRASQELDVSELFKHRELIDAYLPSGDNMSAISRFALGLFSPTMTLNDFKWFSLPGRDFDQFTAPNMNLFETLFLDDGLSMYDYVTEFQVPVTFIMGDSDWVTPVSLVEEYYSDITAPEKELLFIENAGHMPFMDNSDSFVKTLKGALEG